MESSYQKALDELCNHAMQYEEDYDWEENACGGYFQMDEESLKELRRPLQQLVNKAIPKKPSLREENLDLGTSRTLCCPNCVQPIINVWNKKDYKPRYCHYCGQKLDWGEDDAN